MPTYLDLDGYAALATIPPEFVDEVEVRYPGFTLKHLEVASAWIDSRLRKRYAVPFEAPAPLVVQMWLARLVTPRVLWRRGVDPTDEQYVDIRDDAKAVEAELLEAADSNEGLYDLPLRADLTGSGISKGGPFGYSEQSPYVWTDRQVEIGRDEDRNGGGTFS